MRKIRESDVLNRVKRVVREMRLEMIRMTFRQGATVGWPDVLVIAPGGAALFLELKRPGQPLREIQKVRRNRLVELGFDYANPDTPTAAEKEIVDFVVRRCVSKPGAGDVLPEGRDV